MTEHTLHSHAYDVMLSGTPHPKGFTALRLADAHHQNINVGDLVQMSGHNTIMDRQRFQVVAKMDHPDIAHAISSIEHSGLSARDKIRLADSFRNVNSARAGGETAGPRSVVALHLAPHGTANFNRRPAGL